jgi:transcriptional regulator with XRE-family HTH domain
MNFQSLLEIMAQHGITRLAHIARELDVSPQAVSNWKARDQVPYKIVAILQEKYGSSMETDLEEGAIDQKKSAENGQPEIQSLTPTIPYPYPPYPYTEEEDSISLREIINILLKHRKMLIIITTITCNYAI